MNVRWQEKRKTASLHLLFLFAGLLLYVTSCTAPPPPSLHNALLYETGYQLGESHATATVKGAECAAGSRYDGANSLVLLLICVAPRDGNSGRVRYRISFTPPEAGHRVWKIDASVPDATLDSLENLADLEKRYGPSQKRTGGNTLRWEVGATYLEIRQDRYGVQFSLWDRSIRQS